MTAPRKLTADDVCAFCWDHASQHLRAGICALASLNQNLAILDWYELGESDHVKLRIELADVIEHNASRQRAEWCQRARAAA